jgi:hypothetical protein
MKAKKPTVADIRRAAEKVGGSLEPDGCGGWDLLAPNGKRWVESETWCQPIPLAEAETADDRSCMLRFALACCVSGVY